MSRVPFWYLEDGQHISQVRTIPSPYPIAKVLQSEDGASAVTGIWSSVRVDRCSDVDGSKSMILP
jgi:hypothetical protein